MNAYKGGSSIEQAAFATPTGKIAKQLGYGKASGKVSEAGSEVKITFTK